MWSKKYNYVLPPKIWFIFGVLKELLNGLKINYSYDTYASLN